VLSAEFGHPVLGAPVQQTVLHLQGGTAGAAATSEAAQVGAMLRIDPAPVQLAVLHLQAGRRYGERQREQCSGR
jgi:hypothetical protein